MTKSVYSHHQELKKASAAGIKRETQRGRKHATKEQESRVRRGQDEGRERNRGGTTGCGTGRFIRDEVQSVHTGKTTGMVIPELRSSGIEAIAC